MTETRLTRIEMRARRALADMPDFAERVLMDFGEGGRLMINGAAREVSREPENSAADSTIEVTLDDFVRMAKGELDPTRALLTQRLRIHGNFALVMRLAQALGETRAED